MNDNIYPLTVWLGFIIVAALIARYARNDTLRDAATRFTLTIASTYVAILALAGFVLVVTA